MSKRTAGAAVGKLRRPLYQDPDTRTDLPNLVCWPWPVIDITTPDIAACMHAISVPWGTLIAGGRVKYRMTHSSAV